MTAANAVDRTGRVELELLAAIELIGKRDDIEVLLRAYGREDAVTRAHIADPEIVRKIERGVPERIRPCVGANLCIARAVGDKALRCFNNPDAGREAEWGTAEPAATPRRVRALLRVGTKPPLMVCRTVSSMVWKWIVSVQKRYLSPWAAIPPRVGYSRAVIWMKMPILVRAMSSAQMMRAKISLIFLATCQIPMSPRLLSVEIS